MIEKTENQDFQGYTLPWCTFHLDKDGLSPRRWRARRPRWWFLAFYWMPFYDPEAGERRYRHRIEVGWDAGWEFIIY